MNQSDLSRLTSLLSKYKERLCKWVLAGIGGDGDPQIQWADYIITVDENSNTYSIRTIDDYIILLLSTMQGQLGTPFQWTYPSGGKGKRIQLKCKMI